jgi:phage FluMu protein Com
MMTRAMPGNSSLYFEVNCPECKKLYQCQVQLQQSRVCGVVG